MIFYRLSRRMPPIHQYGFVDPSLREPVAEFTHRVRALEQRVQAI